MWARLSLQASVVGEEGVREVGVADELTGGALSCGKITSGLVDFHFEADGSCDGALSGGQGEP